jgi:PAS domain S-box-containing protein
VSSATQAVVFNAVPLFVLAASYAAVAGSVLPTLWRMRGRAHLADWGLALVFPAVSIAAAIFGVLVVREERPVGGHVWLSFAAILVALVPAALLLMRGRERSALAAGMGRTIAAEERVSMRDRELEAVTALSAQLVRAHRELDVAKLLVRQVMELLDVGFASVTLVDASGDTARGMYAERNGEPFEWWSSVTVDLRHEPSGIASAVFDAAPVTVYDVAGSPLVNKSLANRVGAKSGTFVPMIAEARVIGVLTAASTSERHAFSPDELALLKAIAAEAALALARLSSASALAEALGREQTAAAIARRLRAEREPAAVASVAESELSTALDLDHCEVVLGGDVLVGSAVEVGGDRVATLVTERATPLAPAEELLVEAVARELGSALQTAGLLVENARRLEQQQALLRASQVVTGELTADAVLRRLVEQVTSLLHAEAADCYLIDRERGTLRCAAVHGFDPSLVGFEFVPDGLSEDALRGSAPLGPDEERALAAPIPSPAYTGFSRVLVAPMTWSGETLGVIGIGVRDRRRAFASDDVELLAAFASLAALALRNAESYEASIRQARVQRGFYRIAALLGESLSLSETYDATAHAAAEALGGDFAAVFAPGGAGLELEGGFEVPPELRHLPLPPALAEAAAGRNLIAAAQVAGDERFGHAWQESPISSLLGIPVSVDGAGLVLVCFREPREFSRDDLELAQQVAGAARGALERSRLFEAERAARALSQRLARAGGLLARELDPPAVLQAAAREALHLLAADSASISLLDGDELVVRATEGNAARAALGRRSPSTAGPAGEVLAAGAPVAHATVELGQAGYLGVPLRGPDDGVRGVLSVYSTEPRRWHSGEIEALSTLAANAAVALVSAEQYRHVALEREQSGAILANIADGIVAVDRDGRVVVWNRAAEAITGVQGSEALGRTTAEVLHRDLASGRGGTTRLVSISRGGAEVWLALSEVVMLDPGGAAAGRIFAFQDISAEHAVEQMKTDFVSGVSLELRAPLTSIYGFAQTLLRDDVAFGDDERRTFLDFIAREAERLTETVDALLNVARLETGDLAVSIEPTDVRAVVDALVAASAPVANGHRIVVDVPAQLPAAQADPVKLRDVLDQLVGNAVKFSPQGGTVTISAHHRDDTIELAVTDEGVGIPSSEQERIFAKFAKAGAGQSRGTGVGLFIAQGLVREMGGRIRVHSNEGEGSRFAFELPLVGE